MTDRLHRLFPRPDGEPTHFERLMTRAREEFNEGRWMRGLENVAHAAYVEDRPDEGTRLRLVRDVLGSTWGPDGDAAA